MKADRQTTEARNFLDPRSYVAKDGREILYGKDWIARKWELWQRGEGRCEYRIGNWRCYREMVIPSHIIPRKDKTQRDDRLSNLKGHCVEHDQETEQQSWRKTRFGERVTA